MARLQKRRADLRVIDGSLCGDLWNDQSSGATGGSIYSCLQIQELEGIENVDCNGTTSAD